MCAYIIYMNCSCSYGYDIAHGYCKSPSVFLFIVITYSKHTYCIFKAANLYTESCSWYSNLLWSDSHQSSGRHVVHFEAPRTYLYCTHNLPL